MLFSGSRVLQNAVAEGDTRTITLHHIHTDENITITFKRDGRYDESGLEKLNWFLRDWRRNQQTRMDPHLIDLVWEVQRESGSHEPIWVVCGYRSPETNAMLRRRSTGVARFSQHMLGHALDFYIPGVPLDQLRAIGLRLQRGGVGFYPSSGSPFVHLDTGSVRHWPRMTHDQLVRVFPDGRTVHVPSDGRPLAGYALALADIRKRGDTVSEMSLDAARGAGVDVANAGLHQTIVKPLAKLFGLKHDDEEDDAGGAAVATANPPSHAADPLPARAKAAVAAAIDGAEDKIATEKAKLVQIAARTEEKLAAEKSKIAQAAGKAHIVSRAEAAAPTTPNQIILARGFWQGVPDGMAAVRPAQNSANPLAALPRPAPPAASEPDATASVGPFPADAGDTATPTVALAFAEQGEREAPTEPLLLTATTALAASAPMPRATITGPSAVQASSGEMTIAMKRVNGRPASAILTVASKTKPAIGSFIDDPWLRAVMVTPSVDRSLCITLLGVRDFQSLAPQMVKPANSVMMTFAADPNPGLAQDRFTGSAIVFVSTVTYPVRTADLR